MTRRDENHAVPSLRGEVETLFRRALGAGPAGRAGGWMPTLDLIEEPGRFVVEMDVPGVRLEDLAISVAGRRLTIAGRRESVRESGGPGLRVRERFTGSFSRTVELPEPVDAGRVGATLREGILRVELPRREGRR
jgi:HSP20 family protein